MFSVPQDPQALLPDPDWLYLSPAEAEILLALGAVNHAVQIGCELLECWGPRPATLRLLARAYLAKRQPNAARHFLNRLRGDLVHGSWARRQLARLAGDPGAPLDEDIRRVRSVMFTEGTFQKRSRLGLLAGLRATNRQNRMAGEYLVAQAMLFRRPDMAVRALTDEEAPLDYRILPEQFAEAVLIYRHATGADVELGGATIARHVERRVHRCLELMNAQPTQAAAARALVTQYGDTYFCYYVTGRSGHGDE